MEFDTVDEFLTETLRCLFISHTGWMNIKYERHGGLFSSPFKDIEVVDEEYMKRMVLYTNWNHVHHGITNKLEDYLTALIRISYIIYPQSLIKKRCLNYLEEKRIFSGSIRRSCHII